MARFPTGPHQRLQNLQTQELDAILQGNQAAIADIALARGRAMQQLADASQRLQGGGIFGGGAGVAGDLSTAARGIGVANLVSGGGRGGIGGIMQAAAGAAELAQGAGLAGGPAALLAAGLKAGTEALRLFKEGIQNATERLNSFGAAGITSGGTAGQTGALSGIGIAPDQQTAIAARVRQAVVGGGEAAVAAGQLGVGFPGPRIAGTTNEAQFLQQILEQLRERNDRPEEQLRLARMLGPEIVGILPQLRVSPDVAQRQRRTGSLEAEILGNDRASQAARDLAENTRILQQNMQNALAFGLSPLISALKDLSGAGADAAEKLARGAKEHPAAATGAISGAISGGLHGGIPGAVGGGAANAIGSSIGERIGQWIAHRMGWDKDTGPADKLKKAMDDNTNQLRQANAKADRRATQEGIFGGGDRARGAFPAALRGLELDRAIRHNVLRLGGFRY